MATKTETTDWQVLFSKCATDQNYRTRLTDALAEEDDDPVAALLEEIGLAGDEALKRVHALRSVRGPLLDLAEAFGGPTAFAAP